MRYNYWIYSWTCFAFLNWGLPDFFALSTYNEKLFKLKNLHVFFKLYRLEDSQNPKLFNYFYLCQYFFRRAAYVSNLKTFFKLGKHYQNMEIGFNVTRKSMFSVLSLWIFEIQPLVNLALTRDFVYTNTRLQWVLRDPSIFTEKKTNTGLFNLEDPLCMILTYREAQNYSNFVNAQLFKSLKILLEK